MAKRKARRPRQTTVAKKAPRPRRPAGRSAKRAGKRSRQARPKARRPRRASRRRKREGGPASAEGAAAKAGPPRRRRPAPQGRRRLDRARRTLDEDGADAAVVARHGPPRHRRRAPDAPRSAESMREHAGMTPAITGGDVDVDVEDAYFSGDEAPGGDNPTPDQDVVDDIGKALGVEYQDNEELKAARQGRRARQAPLGARPGLVGGLQGQEVELGSGSEFGLSRLAISLSTSRSRQHFLARPRRPTSPSCR